MEVAVDDVWPQRTHGADESEEKARQIPAVFFADADGFYPVRAELGLESTRVEMHHTDLEITPGGQ